MFRDFARAFEQRIDESAPTVGRLTVNGLLTEVLVRFLPNDAMEIVGLPGDAPPYLKISPEGVSLAPSGDFLQPSEDSDVYRLYRLLDPRRVARLSEVETESSVPGRFEVQFQVAKVAFGQVLVGYGPDEYHDAGASARLDRLRDFVPAIDEVRTAYLVGDAERLTRFSVFDLTRTPTLLSVWFPPQS